MMFKISRKNLHRRRWRAGLGVLVVLAMMGAGYYAWQHYRAAENIQWPASLFQANAMTRMEFTHAQQTLRMHYTTTNWVLPDLGGIPVSPVVMDEFLRVMQNARTQGPRIWGDEKLQAAGLVSATALRLRGWDKNDQVLLDWLLGGALPDGAVMAKPTMGEPIGYALALGATPSVVPSFWIAPEWRDFTSASLQQIGVAAADGALVLRAVDAGAWRVMDLNPTEQVRADAPLPALPYFFERAIIINAQPLTSITPDDAQRRRLDFTQRDGRVLTIIQAPVRGQWWSVLRLTDAGGNALPLHTDGWALLLDDTSNAAMAITRAMVLMPRVAD